MWKESPSRFYSKYHRHFSILLPQFCMFLKKSSLKSQSSEFYHFSQFTLAQTGYFQKGPWKQGPHSHFCCNTVITHWLLIGCFKPNILFGCIWRAKIFLMKICVRKHSRYETSGFGHFSWRLIFAQVRKEQRWYCVVLAQYFHDEGFWRLSSGIQPIHMAQTFPAYLRICISTNIQK